MSISGQVALSPAKKPAPRAIIAKIEKNLLFVFPISRKISFKNANFMRTALLSSTNSYHSIFSIGTGFSFISIPVTLLLFMWITLSAIGVRARLWVITITVIPSIRQQSWRS